MAYEKIGFSSGNVLKASDLNHMEEGIASSATIEDVSTEVTEQLTIRAQLKPEFANSIEECTDTSKLYVLPDGYIYAYMSVSQTIGHTNRILSSFNSDGTPYNNGAGYKEGYRLNSSAVETATANTVVSGFIAYNGEDIEVRVPNTALTGSANYVHVFDKNFAWINTRVDGVVVDSSTRQFHKWVELGAVREVDETGSQKIRIPKTIIPSNTSYIRVSGHTDIAVSADTFDVALDESLDAPVVVTGKKWVSTGHAFVPAGYEDRILALESDSTDHESRLKLLEANQSGSGVPSYWLDELEAKADAIQQAMEAAGRNKSAFLWYTDAHWTTNYGQSPMMLKYLSKHTGMEKTFFGGDVSVAESGEVDMLRTWQEMVGGIPNHHSVIGNHDAQVTDLPTEKAEFFFGPERTGDVVGGVNDRTGKDLYYFIDNHIENTRYICLGTGGMWLNADEAEWCANTLNGTPDGWHIVIISHLWLNNDYTNGGIITAPVAYTQGLLDMFDAYNYRMSGAESFTSTPYDFANAKGKIEFVIGGHVHQDYDFATTKGIPVILTECDAWQERDDISVATKGTTTENCVYAVIADYAAKSVKVINVGRGETRSKAIPDIVTYTNVLPLAIAADGSIYNGIGYKPNTRFTGNGGEKTDAGYFLTGYIPIRIGDIIRFKNLKWLEIPKVNTYGRIMIQMFGESFEFINSSAGYYVDSPPSAAWSPVFAENGDVIQLTLPTAYSASIRYIRICFDELTPESIITINEEIT